MDKQPSYLGAFIRHPYNRVALLAAGCAAIFASIPFGWPGLALVGVLGLGTEALAALGIPELPSFKAWADREHHHRLRAERRLRLLAELSQYGDARALASYEQMYRRVQSLYQTAGDPRSTLSRDDVEKLEDLTVDYLGLCVVSQSLRQRRDAPSEEGVIKRIASLQGQLLNKALTSDEERQLRSALAEYTEVLNRSRRLATRRSTLEATLISMPDKLEEVYQLVITAPYSSEMGGKLEESLARLRIAEEVAAEFDSAESFDFTPPRASSASPATLGQAARQAAQSVRSRS
ncbi:hypothetical protein BH10PSE16_BH10PSE16_09410 [soil metagenome]